MLNEEGSMTTSQEVAKTKESHRCVFIFTVYFIFYVIYRNYH